MTSPSTLLIRQTVLFSFLLFSFFKAQSQCNPPSQLPTGDCATAPFTCLVDACYETLSNFGGPPYNGWCGNNTAIHNPQYFAFIPTQPNVQINIHVDGCDNGQGLQSAILGACPWTNSDVIVCNPGTNQGGTMILQANGLVVGQTYWLVIDGSGGALCQYTIDFVSGIETPGFDDELDPAQTMAVPGVVCQGYDDFTMVTGPQISLAHGYLWVLGWSGDTVTSTLPIHTIDIPNDAPAGTWDICVRAFSGCDQSEEVCFQVEIVEIDDVDKDPETFCQEQFPFSWHGVNIPGEGTYNATFDNDDGCPYDSIWNVEEYPIVPVGMVDTLHCFNENFDPFIYEGEEYDATGMYDLDYPGMGLNGCDSTAMLNLTVAGLDAFIDFVCQDGEYVFSVLVQEVIPTNATLQYQWYVDGVEYDNSSMISILANGIVVVDAVVEVNTPAGSCFYDLEDYVLNTNQHTPPAPETNPDTLLCAQGGIFFHVTDCDPILGYEYVWSGPPGVEVYQDGSCDVEMDFSFTQGGQVCVYAINECGEGESTCFVVDIIPTPEASFTYDTDVCADSTTIVVFTGDHSVNGVVNWDFGGATIVSGSGDGPYELFWSLPGDKIINLSVSEPGCDTAFASAVVTVTNTQAPTINCSSTISSVNFIWVDVPGVVNYEVFIAPGPAIVLPAGTTNYMVSGLTPGTIVNMTLTTVYSGACPPNVQTVMCTAENCPPPTIELGGPTEYCLNAPVNGTLTAVVNGSPSTGVWSGSGIIDPALGIFDSTVSGAGQHQLTHTVDVNGCPFSAPYIVNVYDSLIADFTADPLICISDVANVTYTGNAAGTANFAWDFGTATIVAGSGIGPYQLSFATPGSKPIRLQVSENGCSSDVITNNTQVEPTLTAPAVNCAAQTNNVEFCWPDDPTITYTVTTLSGQIGVQTGTCILFNGLVPGNIVQIEILSQRAGPCPERRDTFDCEARLCPTPTIAITPVTDICLYAGTQSIDLEVTITNGNGGVGSWSGPGITNANTGNFDPNVAGAGSHLVSYNYEEDQCDFVESITINVYDPPVAFISNSSLVLTCSGGNILTLDGTGSTGNGITYEWSTGDGAINPPTDQDVAVAAAPGTYKLKVTTADGCVDSTSVVVVQDANAPIADAGPDRVITCNELSFLQGGGSSVGPNITYLWTTPDGNIVGADDQITATVDKTGVYTIVVNDAGNGCQSADQAIVTIDTSVTTITLTPGDTIDCNTPISGVSAVLGDPTGYTLAWTTSDGVIEGDTTGADIDVSQGGSYTLTIRNTTNGCEKSASADVEESDEIIDEINVSLMNITCFGDDDGTLVVNGITGGKPPYTYQWSVSPQGGTDLSMLSPGTYGLTVSDANGCSIARSFTITEPDKLTVDVGLDQTVAIDDSVKINLTTNANSNAIQDINWTGYDGLDCPGCPVLEFIASSSATFAAILTDTAGCTASDSMRLTVIVPRIIFIPTVFSPNGDDINDKFTISGRRNLINIAYMRIYDRWGNQVFENTDLDPGVEEDGWDGKFSGDPAAPGVYVYVAQLMYEDGSDEVIKGGITLIR